MFEPAEPSRKNFDVIIFNCVFHSYLWTFTALTRSLRPRHWRPHNTTLAASARTGQLQSGCYGISRIAWSCPTIPQSASSCRWPAQPSTTPFFFVASAARSTITFVNRRSSFFFRRRGHEHTAGGCPVFPFTSSLPPASEDIPLPQIISWCCMTGRLRFRGLCNGLLLF